MRASLIRFAGLVFAVTLFITLEVRADQSATRRPDGTSVQAPAATSTVPTITSPKHRDSVPRPVDPPCQPGPGCPRVYVEGTIPPGSSPYLVVAPANTAPKMWIQPPIAAIRRDGQFDGLVYLGTPTVGQGERYTIYLLGCASKDRFKEGQVIAALPTDCQVSDPVTVTRTK